LPDTLCGGNCVQDAITWGELLANHGRAAEADSLLRRRFTTPGIVVTDLLRVLALARVAERAGDRLTAVDAYARIEDSWGRSDPEFQPFVHEARTALARLSNDKP
jgi:hypothetical protein